MASLSSRSKWAIVNMNLFLLMIFDHSYLTSRQIVIVFHIPLASKQESPKLLLNFHPMHLYSGFRLSQAVLQMLQNKRFRGFGNCLCNLYAASFNGV